MREETTSEFFDKRDLAIRYLGKALQELKENSGLDCSEIAEHLHELIGTGDIVTYSVQKRASNRDQMMNNKFIYIPSNATGLAGPYAYHTVYIYKRMVYTAEIAGFCTPIKDYEKRLHELNKGKEIFIYKEN